MTGILGTGFVFEASCNDTAWIDWNGDDEPSEKDPSFIRWPRSIVVEQVATQDDRVSGRKGEDGQLLGGEVVLSVTVLVQLTVASGNLV